MFDRLIESDSSGADFRPRGRYFLVSSVVVGALFVSAVIASIYSAEIGLGNDSFELSALVVPAPPVPDVVPEQTRPRPQSEAAQQRNELPQRTELLRRLDETPVDTPPISVTQNTVPPRPIGPVELEPRNTDPPLSGPINNESGTSVNNSDTSMLVSKPETPVKVDRAPDPPPAVPSQPKYVGVVNGYATYLPKPPYPPLALHMNIEGKVDVQITIDETGRVISAKAASGHPFLLQAAEQAARNARFKPTTLRDVPVKVTGVIVYNFTRN